MSEIHRSRRRRSSQAPTETIPRETLEEVVTGEHPTAITYDNREEWIAFDELPPGSLLAVCHHASGTVELVWIPEDRSVIPSQMKLGLFHVVPPLKKRR